MKAFERTTKLNESHSFSQYSMDDTPFVWVGEVCVCDKMCQMSLVPFFCCCENRW